jgi:2-oxoglutarate dehydrogenase E2 component (dihydrolipoamide succinyltransferase)
MSNIVVPELGESVVEARVARWLKKAGDRVAAGEALVELETEKVDLEVSAEKAGVLSSIARQEGEDVKIGEVLGVIDDSAGAAAAPPEAEQPAADGQPEAGGQPAATPAQETDAPGRQAATGDAPAAPVPAAAGTAAAVGGPARPPPRAATAPSPGPGPSTPAAGVPPSRPAPGPRPAGARNERRVRMSKRRQTIARRLVEAQHTAAMLTTFNEVDMTAVMALRERRKASFKEEFGVGLGVTSFFVKSVVAALRGFPALNAEIEGDEIVYKDYYDIGMAVGAEGGLVVPVIRDADTLSFVGIERAIRDFASRAADGTLTLEDLRGGTFTITNGGVFGSLLSTPILNPPQVGILGLHKIQDRVVPVDGKVVVRSMMYVALSYDHRIVDGREAVQFLARVKDYVEDPGQLLLEG